MSHYLKRELYELIKRDESIFDFIQALSLDGLWYWDLEHPEHAWMNPKFWTTLGYDPADMPHRADAWQDIIFPEDRDEALRLVQAHFANPDVPYEQTVRYRHKDGSTVWIRCRGLAIRDDDGTPVRMLGAHVDITDIKEAELRARATNQLYKTFADNQSAYFIKIDLEGNFTFLNDLYCHDFGWSRELLLGQSSLYGVPEEDHALCQQVARECFANPGKRVKARLRKTSSRGVLMTTDWEFTALADESGQPLELVCIGTDVSQQVTAEAALKASEAQFRFIAEHTSDGIALFNYGNMIYASPAYRRILGYSLEEETARTHDDIYALIHPEDRERIHTLVTRAIAEQQLELTYEFRALHKDGHYVWREDRATMLYGAGGLPVQSVLIARDITDRKRQEADLLRTTTLLNDAQRMANMGGWELDVATDETISTEQIYAIHEVPLGTPINKVDGIAFYHPDDRVIISNALSQTIEQQVPFDVQCRFITAKGNHRWVRSSGYPLMKDGQVTHVIGMFQDITEQKLLEERTRESEQRLHSTLASMDDLVVVLDAEGVFQEAYQAQGRFYIPPRDFIGRHYRNVLPAHIGSELDAIYERVQYDPDGMFSFDYHLEDNGEVSWYSSKASPRTNNNGYFDGFTVVARNITQRKRAEDALRKSEQQFELFFNQSLTGFFFMMLDEPIMWDEAKDKEGLLEYVFDHQPITRANSAFADQYGTTPDALIGDTPRDMFAHDIAQGKRVWRQFFDTGHLHIETEERRADGSQVFIEGDYICLYDDQGRIMGHFGVQQDVTSRKRAERALAGSEAKFRSFVENANDVIITLNPQGELLYISPKWEDVKGFSSQGLLGTSFVQHIHPDDVTLAFDALKTVVTEKTAYNGLVYRSQHGDGTWHWFSANGAPISDDTGNVTAILVTVRDITSDKHAEQTMQATLKRLEQALSQNTLLMREVHHRVKNNMAVIASLLALQSHGLKDETAKEALRESRSRVVVMAEIHELMYQHDNTNSIAFDDYLMSLVSRMERSFSRGKQQIRFALDTSSVELGFNQAIPLGLIVNELLTNATKYAFPEGQPDAQVGVHVTVSSDQLQLTVADNGVGVADMAVLEQSDSLGMTIIHSLTDQLGGSIHFDHHPDNTSGLRAVLHIPIEKPASDPATAVTS